MNNVVTHWSNTGWESAPDSNIMVHGSAFHDDQLLRGRQLAAAFGDAECEPEAWADVLSQCNGFFAIARQTTTTTIVAVDRVRSIPIFYGEQGGAVFISDEAEWVRQRVGDTEMDPVAQEEFQLAGYVTGSDTLYPTVKQLQAGELLHIDDGDQPKLSLHRWYRFTHTESENWDEPTLREELDQCAEASVRRLVEYAAGRKIVIPLSGGYDSRLIALLLKRIGYDNILTFTYGVRGNKESEYSRRVAEALSLPWHFVEYTPKKWWDAWQTEERLAYQQWGSGWASLPHVQDWLAVREMKRESRIPEDSVLAPGHGAMAILSNLKALPNDPKLGDAEDSILASQFSLAPLEARDYLRKLTSRVSAGLDNYENPNDVFSHFGFFIWQEKESKFLVNAVRVYEFYGYDWWMPLWDAEFMHFWKDVPLDLRMGKEWYVDYVKALYMSVAASEMGNASQSSKGPAERWIRALYSRIPGPFKRVLRAHRMPFPSSGAQEGRYENGDFIRLWQKGYSKNGVAAYYFLKDFGS